MSDAGTGVGTDAREGSPESDDGTGSPEAPDAFQALGDGTRLSILRALHDHEGPPPAFSTLQAAVGVEVSSRFAYHLRQLTGRYVRKVSRGAEADDGTDPGHPDAGSGTPAAAPGDAGPGSGGTGEGGRPAGEEGYALTYAGRKVARAVAAGTYTESVDLDPVELDDPCPHCGEEDLLARCADNVLGVACEACDRPVLSLPFPPPGYRDRDPETVPEAFDRHHRHRLALLREGVCPECSGVVEGRVEPLSGPGRSAGDGAGRADGNTDHTRRDGEHTAGDADHTAGREESDGPPGRVRAAFECAACGYAIRTPVALTLLTHPEVVSFYRDHGHDVSERPLWNVGDEWREAVISRDPLAVTVSTRLDDELLELFVDGRASVVDSRRTDADGA